MSVAQQQPTPTDSDPNMGEALRRVRGFTSRTVPATVAACRDDYAAGAELRRKFDATARRQHGR